MDNWGTQIRLARTRAGLTQQQLSQLTGVNQATISRVESGDAWPSRETVSKLLSALAEVQPPEGMAVPGAEAPGKISKAGTGYGELHELAVPDLLNVEPEPVEWIVHDVAARGAVTMLAGRYGQGKSLLGQSFAVAVAQGDGEVAGFRVEAGRALVLDAEKGAANLRAVTARQFDLEADEDKLRQLVDHGAHTPDLLVLDTWTSLWRGSEASVEQVQDCLNMLRDVARDYSLAVILLHHTTKSGEGFRGSGAIGATIEAVFTLDRDDDMGQDVRVVECEKLRIAPEPTPRYFRIGYPLRAIDGAEGGDDE